MARSGVARRGGRWRPSRASPGRERGSALVGWGWLPAASAPMEVDAMIQVTESAADLLATLDRPAGRVVRLEQIDEQRLGLVLGEAREGDQVVEREGQDLLHIPAEISAALDGWSSTRPTLPPAPGCASALRPTRRSQGRTGRFREGRRRGVSPRGPCRPEGGVLARPPATGGRGRRRRRGAFRLRAGRAARRRALPPWPARDDRHRSASAVGTGAGAATPAVGWLHDPARAPRRHGQADTVPPSRPSRGAGAAARPAPGRERPESCRRGGARAGSARPDLRVLGVRGEGPQSLQISAHASLNGRSGRADGCRANEPGRAHTLDQGTLAPAFRAGVRWGADAWVTCPAWKRCRYWGLVDVEGATALPPPPGTGWCRGRPVPSSRGRRPAALAPGLYTEPTSGGDAGATHHRRERVRFEGKVALVTGGGRGIGAATCEVFARDGARVAVCDLDEAPAREVAERLDGRGLAVACDVSRRDQVEATVQRVVDAFGRLDILVCCAGIIRDNLIHKMTDEDWQAVIDTHLRGSFLCAQAAQRVMVPQRYGKIVFLSSTSALGNRGQANYSAAKAGLQGMARTLAIELGPFNINVNAVAPGFVETRMTEA